MLTARILLAPHVSTLLMDQHRGHRTEMLEAYAAAARELEAEQPAAIVALTARWEAPGPFLADAGRRHTTLTDYYGFGVEVRYDCHGAPALARAIVDAARAAGVRAATTTRGVDSGVSVPLHFLASRRLYPVVPVSLARGTAAEHRAWGAALRRALDAWPERVAFVVGGMLSHNVHAWNLKRETPEAQTFDGRVLEALKAGAWDELARLEMRPHGKAQPEANLMHLEVLRGLLGEDLAGAVRCYESGPGVGAALVEFLVGEPASPAGGGRGGDGVRGEARPEAARARAFRAPAASAAGRTAQGPPGRAAQAAHECQPWTACGTGTRPEAIHVAPRCPTRSASGRPPRRASRPASWRTSRCPAWRASERSAWHSSWRASERPAWRRPGTRPGPRPGTRPRPKPGGGRSRGPRPRPR